MTPIDAAIVGAGPYALATAAFLRAIGADVRVFGEAMGFWETMPRGMFLRSFRSASSIADPLRGLSLERYEAAVGKTIPSPVPLHDFILYGRWFQEQIVPDVDSRRVRLVKGDRDGFLVTLDDGEAVRARRVIVAAGIAPFAWRPPQFAGLARGLVSHSSNHRTFDEFRGQRVIVIGGGQSALESAALLREAEAEVEVLVRGEAIHFLRGERLYARAGVLRDVLYPPLGVGPPGLNAVMGMPSMYRRLPRGLRERLACRVIRPAAAAWLRPRLAQVRITTGRSVTSATRINGQVRLRLDDGTEKIAEHAVLGTGYRVDVRRYLFLHDSLVDAVRVTNGSPVLSPAYESSVEGLFFVGAVAAASAGPGMRFVSHTGPAAAAVTDRVVGRGRRRRVRST